MMQLSVKKTGSLLVCSMVALPGCYLVEPPEKTESTAPKDPYGFSYLIGDLGGKPVNLPSTKVDLVEYDDSPGWDVEKIKNYNPPPRTYASVIESFGFDMRYTDGLVRELYHKAPQYSEQQYQAQKNLADSKWLSVIVYSGRRYNRAGLDPMLINFLKTSPKMYPAYIYKKTVTSVYGLELYASPGVDPSTGVPWRRHSEAKDLYVYKDDKGKVGTIIQCVNANIRRPSCVQIFNLDPDMKVSLHVFYARVNLKDWEKIQREATKAVEAFIVPLKPNTTN